MSLYHPLTWRTVLHLFGLVHCVLAAGLALDVYSRRKTPIDCSAVCEECDLQCLSARKYVTFAWEPRIAEGWRRSRAEVVGDGQPKRPERSSVCDMDLCLARWFIWLVGIFLLAYRPKFLVSG